MSLEYDPKVNLRHYPMPMAKYGTNPYGEPLYRIVFRDSRRHLVGGAFAGEGPAYHWVPKYRHVSAAWILERWHTAFEFTRMSQLQWDTTMVDPVSGWLILGPYPSRGEYDLVWEFDQGVSADSLDNIIAAIEKGRQRSFGEVRAAHDAEYQAEEKETRRLAQEEIRDAVTAFGIAPMSSLSGVNRGTKTVPELRSAQELGLRAPRRNFRRNPKDLRGLDYTSTLMVGAESRGKHAH